VTERDAMLPLSESSVAASCVLTLMSAVGGERPHVDSAVDDGNAQEQSLPDPGLMHLGGAGCQSDNRVEIARV
jgi:hypothetical protein